MKRSWLFALTPLMGIALALPAARAQAGKGARTPIALDFDIGSDIDDAFALAMLLRSQAVDLQAVTTVSGDPAARARIAAKMLAVAGRRSVPVAVGQPSKTDPFPQARWAEGFSSAALTSESAVSLLHKTVVRDRGRLVLIALGPLSNVAALLKQHPEDAHGIKEIVLMGGSIARGYQPGSGPTPEYNIAEDAAAAQTVFTSGVPLLVAPLDVTAALQLETPERDKIFARHTPLTEALRELYTLWGQPTPTLHDPMAVALLLHPGLCHTEPMHVDVGPDGMTRSKAGAPPNATVATRTDPATFLRYYVSLF